MLPNHIAKQVKEICDNTPLHESAEYLAVMLAGAEKQTLSDNTVDEFTHEIEKAENAVTRLKELHSEFTKWRNA